MLTQPPVLEPTDLTVLANNLERIALHDLGSYEALEEWEMNHGDARDNHPPAIHHRFALSRLFREAASDGMARTRAVRLIASWIVHRAGHLEQEIPTTSELIFVMRQRYGFSPTRDEALDSLTWIRSELQENEPLSLVATTEQLVVPASFDDFKVKEAIGRGLNRSRSELPMEQLGAISVFMLPEHLDTLAELERLEVAERQAEIAILAKERARLGQIEVDVLDALDSIWLAQFDDGVLSSSGSIKVGADTILDACGVQPRHTEGRRRGHRKLDRVRYALALKRASMVRVAGQVRLGTKRKKGEQIRTVSWNDEPFCNTTIRWKGQLNLDGSPALDAGAEPVWISYAPGEARAELIRSEDGRRLIYRNRRLLAYHAENNTIEKRLGRYLDISLAIRRSKEPSRGYSIPRSVRKLVENGWIDSRPILEPVIGERPRFARWSSRLAAALDRLTQDRIIGGWQYTNAFDPMAERASHRLKAWLEAVVEIEASEFLQELSKRPETKQVGSGATIPSLQPEKVREFRENLGLSLDAAAKETAVSRRTYWNVEKGKRVSNSTARSIARWMATRPVRG